MGAHDAYIARQFARLVLTRSALGALGGIAIALLSFYGLGLSAQANLGAETGLAMFAGRWLGPADFILLASLAVAMVAVATVTAWATVMRALRSMV
jgi:cell division protein FtsX